MTGTVKFFNRAKGYGFIIDEWTEDNYFVHISDLIDEIKDNDRVTFQPVKTDKGMSATEVTLIKYYK